MSHYKEFAATYARSLHEGKSYHLGDLKPLPRPELAGDAPKALILSPHPDDECIIGALPLRLMREARMNVVNVAVTQGSKKERQAERFQELKNACWFLGFGLLAIGPAGLERIDAETRQNDRGHWNGCVNTIAEILTVNRPRVVFYPHDQDWNSTHIGTHFLLMDALKTMPIGFECHVIETEFWGQMTTPNLMVESSVDEAADLMAATSFHVGEVKRNPYHLLLPAWMQDNVRRGSELVGGQGGTAPDFTFATLYRLRKWTRRRLEKVWDGGRFLAHNLNPGGLFA